MGGCGCGCAFATIVHNCCSTFLCSVAATLPEAVKTLYPRLLRVVESNGGPRVGDYGNPLYAPHTCRHSLGADSGVLVISFMHLMLLRIPHGNWAEYCASHKMNDLRKEVALSLLEKRLMHFHLLRG